MKTRQIIFFLTFFLTLPLSIHGSNFTDLKTQIIIHQGIGFGSALAISISWNHNNSIFWAIIHGILGWIYVIWITIYIMVIRKNN